MDQKNIRLKGFLNLLMNYPHICSSLPFVIRRTRLFVFVAWLRAYPRGLLAGLGIHVSQFESRCLRYGRWVSRLLRESSRVDRWLAQQQCKRRSLPIWRRARR